MIGMAAAGVATASAITKKITFRMFVTPFFVVGPAAKFVTATFLLIACAGSTNLLRPMHGQQDSAVVEGQPPVVE